MSVMAFFFFFHAVSFELNFFFDRSFPLIASCSQQLLSKTSDWIFISVLKFVTA